MRLPDGRRGRAIMFSFFPRPEGPGNPPPDRKRRYRPGAREIESVQNSVYRFDIRLAVVSGIATLSFALLMIWIIGRGLRPLQTLAHRIAGFEEPNIAGRIDLPNCPTELQPVVGRLNEMLAKLQSAFAREKAFAADVADELHPACRAANVHGSLCVQTAQCPRIYPYD